MVQAMPWPAAIRVVRRDGVFAVAIAGRCKPLRRQFVAGLEDRGGRLPFIAELRAMDHVKGRESLGVFLAIIAVETAILRAAAHYSGDPFFQGVLEKVENNNVGLVLNDPNWPLFMFTSGIKGRLPEDRVELYQEMVRLLLVRWLRLVWVRRQA